MLFEPKGEPKPIKAFFDTEFTGLHNGTTLISIGIIYEDRHKFYAELTDYDKSQVDDWIKENILTKMHLNELDDNSYAFDDGMNTKFVKGTKEYVAKELNFWHEYLFHTTKIEFWSDCLSYDWVLFNDLFGHALNIPENIYYIPFDICTLFKIKGIDPDISREKFAEIDEENQQKHNSLYDAVVIRDCYNKLMKM